MTTGLGKRLGKIAMVVGAVSAGLGFLSNPAAFAQSCPVVLANPPVLASGTIAGIFHIKGAFTCGAA